jgi:glyoxylate reductase
VIYHDCSRQRLIWLVIARNIFNRQLANMPEHYMTRLLFPSNRYVTSGDWKAKGAGVVFIGNDAFNQTLGVIEARGIGRAVLKRGLGFSMKLLYTGPHETPEAAAMGAEYRLLEPLLHESDYLVFTCALTAITKRLIGLDQWRLKTEDCARRGCRDRRFGHCLAGRLDRWCSARRHGSGTVAA